MASAQTPEVERIINLTGANIAVNRLLCPAGFSNQDRTPTAQLAIASGADRMATGFTPNAITSTKSGYLYRDWILEGTATVPVDTTGATAALEPVWLHPTVAGTWLCGTANRPTTIGYDVQQVGIVLVRHLTLGKIKFQITSNLTLPQGAITSSLLRDKPYFDPNRGSLGDFYISGNVTAGERITINGRVYEFRQVGDPLAVGADVGIFQAGAGPWAAVVSAVAAAAAINADIGRSVDGQSIAGTGIVGLFSAAASTAIAADHDYVVATTGVNIAVVSTTGSRPGNRQNLIAGTRIVTADDVTKLASVLGTAEVPVGVFSEDNAPAPYATMAYRRTGASPTFVYQYVDITDAALVLRRVNARQWGLFYREPAAGALLAAGDIIAYTMIQQPATP